MPLQDIVFSLATSSNFAQDGVCFAARGSGLYRSDDGGSTWNYAYTALDLDASLTTMAVVVSPDFASDPSVFAGAIGGTLRSYNGGHTWHIAMFPSPPPVVSTLVISPDYSRDGILLTGFGQAIGFVLFALPQ